MIITLAILCATSAQAQNTKSMDKATTKEHGCMMMSDSVSGALGLTAEQLSGVKESDDRCMKACAKSDANPTGKMDRAAMSMHDNEMKKILTAEQYVKWSATCNTGKADAGTKPSMKD